MVSIKNIPGPGRELPLFVIVSILLHALLVWALGSYGVGRIDLFEAKKDKKKEPIEVEVVELPREPAGKPVRPKKPSFFADRSQSVERETVPVPSIGAIEAGSRPEGNAKKGAATVARVAKSSPAPSLGSKALSGKKDVSPLVSDAPPLSGREGPLLSAKGAGELHSGVPPVDAGEAAGVPKVVPTEEKPLDLMPSQEGLEVIARSQESVPAERAETNRGKKLLLNTADFRYHKYFSGIKRRIEFYWDYPQAAARNGQQGRLQIDFTVKRDGTVDPDSIYLVKSSNYPILDDAAVTAIRLAAPFNPFPEDFDVERITVNGSFVYSLIGY